MKISIEMGATVSLALRVSLLNWCIKKGYLEDEKEQPHVQLGENGLELSFEMSGAGVHEALKEFPNNIEGDGRFPMIVEISGNTDFENILEILPAVKQLGFKMTGCKVDTAGESGFDILEETKLDLTFEVSLAYLETYLFNETMSVQLDNTRPVKAKAKPKKTPPDEEKLEKLMSIVRAPGTEMQVLERVGEFLGISGEDISILLQAYKNHKNLTITQRKKLGRFLAPVFGKNKRIDYTMARIRREYQVSHSEERIPDSKTDDNEKEESHT